MTNTTVCFCRKNGVNIRILGNRGADLFWFLCSRQKLIDYAIHNSFKRHQDANVGNGNVISVNYTDLYKHKPTGL